MIASRWVIRNSTHRFQFSVALVSDATVQLQTCSGRRLKFARASSSAAIGQGPSDLKFPTHHPTHDSVCDEALHSHVGGANVFSLKS